MSTALALPTMDWLAGAVFKLYIF